MSGNRGQPHTIAQSPCLIRGEFLSSRPVQLFCGAAFDGLLKAGLGLVVLVVRPSQLLLLTFFKHLRRGMNTQAVEPLHLLFGDGSFKAKTGTTGAFPDPFGVAGGEVVVAHLLVFLGAFISQGYGVRVVGVAIACGENVEAEHTARVAGCDLSYQVCQRCEEN